MPLFFVYFGEKPDWKDKVEDTKITIGVNNKIAKNILLFIALSSIHK